MVKRAKVYICDSCGVTEIGNKFWFPYRTDYPKGWEKIEHKDFCPVCVFHKQYKHDCLIKES